MWLSPNRHKFSIQFAESGSQLCQVFDPRPYLEHSDADDDDDDDDDDKGA